MKSTEVLLICPWCGYYADRSSSIHDDGSVPQDGDFSMCIGCGKWSIFDPAHPQGLRRPNMVEKFEIALDPDCFKASLVWQQMQGRRRMH